jgi:uncharacterized protein (DUF983 family)
MVTAHTFGDVMTEFAAPDSSHDAATAPPVTTGPRAPGPSASRALWRGGTRRCPRCGSGHLFRRWFKMVPDCPRCALHFEREEGFFLGAYVINYAITQIGIILVLIIGLATTVPDPPVWNIILAGLAVSVFVPLIGYPFSKTLWCALDMIMGRAMGTSWSSAGPDGRQPGFRSRG